MSDSNTFAAIYQTNSWLFGSGAGSLADATMDYRRLLEQLLRERSVGSVLDFGCGDWQFSRLVDWRNVRYLGLDIVPGVVDRNAAAYTDRLRRFAVAPADWSLLPDADLLIVKDVLQHWPNDAVSRFLAEVLPRYPMALVTNCRAPEGLANTDIAVGGWRPLHLASPPFNLLATPLLRFSGIAPPPVSAVWEKETLLVERR